MILWCRVTISVVVVRAALHIISSHCYVRLSCLSKTTCFVILPVLTKTYGERTFAHAAPIMWNNLPDSLRSINSMEHFKSALKSYLFELSLWHHEPVQCLLLTFLFSQHIETCPAKCYARYSNSLLLLLLLYACLSHLLQVLYQDDGGKIKFAPLQSIRLTYSMLSVQVNLKAYIRDKRVCGTETSGATPITIPFHYAISLNADWAGRTGICTIWKFERSPQICLGPQAMFAWPLNPLYSHSAKLCLERNWGNQHWNASLHAADSLMTSQSFYS